MSGPLQPRQRLAYARGKAGMLPATNRKLMVLPIHLPVWQNRKMSKRIICLAVFFLFVTSFFPCLASDGWTYLQIDSQRAKFGDWDEPEFLRYFGVQAFDLDRDGYQDIVSGRYYYLNPGHDMSGEWARGDFGWNVDGMLALDIDGDRYADVIAEALPDIYWLEANELSAEAWNREPRTRAFSFVPTAENSAMRRR